MKSYRYSDDEAREFGEWLIIEIAKACGFTGDENNLPERIDRAVYKGTDCGAWVRFDSEGVIVGSIVEGSDAEFSERIPLDGIAMDDDGAAELCKRFWEALDYINAEACAEWEAAHADDPEGTTSRVRVHASIP